MTNYSTFENFKAAKKALSMKNTVLSAAINFLIWLNPCGASAVYGQN